MEPKYKVVVGYRYHVGMHLVFGLSPSAAPFTALKKIRVGEKDAWVGNVTANTQLNIQEPELFGGDKKEGGIVGLVDVEFGGLAQGVNSYLAAKLTGLPVPAFRGLFALVLRSPQVSALNPYIKPWSVYASRINGGFYPAKAAIGESMNPAHIIYEVLTSYEFGIGLASSDIDVASFTAAADTLYAEGFGLSFLWEGEQSAEDFIGLVLDHINGNLFHRPSTGLITLTLARDDYLIDDLPILDASNILRVDRFSQPLPGELVSEVQVKYDDQATGEEGSVSVQDIAVLSMQGGASVPLVRDLRGIPDGGLASKVALRELRQGATPMAKCEILCNRDAWDLTIGAPFRLQWPAIGVQDMVMRVAEIEFGSLHDGRITIVAVQDVFAVAGAVIGTPVTTGWVNPLSAPAASPYQFAMEAPYWTVAREILGDRDVLLADVDPAAGLLMASGSRPSADAYDFTLKTRTGAAAYVSRGPGTLMPAALLDAAVGRTDTVFAISGGVDLDQVEVGSWAHIDGELVKVASITDTTLAVARGVIDTVPAPHAGGVAIHFIGDFNAIDRTEWSSGQTVNAKVLPRTALGTLLEASATAMNVAMTGRFNRPYPPGKVLVNTVAYPASVSGDLSITWAHRDRTLQTAYIVEQSEASIGPETGTTYTVRIYNAQSGGSLIRTYALIAGTSQAYTVAQATTDNGGTKPANIRIEVESVRAGYVSLQMHQIPAAWV